MQNAQLIIDICPHNEKRLKEMAAFFGYEEIGEFVSDLMARELQIAEDKMHATLFRLREDEFRAILQSLADDPDRKKLN